MEVGPAMLKKDWEFNVLGATNPRNAGALRFYFDFVRAKHSKMEGDIVESGVYQGKSLLDIALMLKELGSGKKVYGFDSFSGFPPVYNEKDDFERFDDLVLGGVTVEHYNDVKKNLKWRNAISRSQVSPASISGSEDF